MRCAILRKMDTDKGYKRVKTAFVKVKTLQKIQKLRKTHKKGRFCPDFAPFRFDKEGSPC